MAKSLQFRISSALKNLIGKDLITDEYVAIFELVKNAYDADATKVIITFNDIYSDNATITIRDNGKGMDFDDINKKWLVVAYSAKKTGKETEGDYRSRIKSQRVFAGAKGVGRFSCDRLGENLRLVTRKDNNTAITEVLKINWNKFEENQDNDFININVQHYSKRPEFKFNPGTKLVISKLRDSWDRDRILKLKRSLEKLINPQYASSDDQFSIILEVPEELNNDMKIVDYGNKLNGEVKNFIFERLGLKTTYIISHISNCGKFVNTTLIDRGILIYKIKEINPYPLLSNIKITLFQLNRAAKLNFTKLMKIEPVNYGSVFMYKNGFRVYPFGEVGDDTLGIDQRKTQGYNRYLGLRDLLGRIEIYGNNDKLVESTSRDGGLIKNSTYEMLKEYFFDRALKRLEKYTVDVIKWGDPLIDKETRKEIHSAINPSDVKNEILEIIKKLTKSSDIIDVNYDPNFLSILEDNLSNSVIQEIDDIKFIATKSNDRNLIKAANKVQAHIAGLHKVKNEYESEISKIQNEKKDIEIKLNETSKINLFLQSVQSLDLDRILTYHHDIRLQSINIQGWLTKLSKAVNSKPVDLATIERFIDVVSRANNKILALSKFTTKANFSSANDQIEADLIDYIEQYSNNVVAEFYSNLRVSIVNNKNMRFFKTFKPIELSVLIDNLVNNSLKAKARNLTFQVISIENNKLELFIFDDGIGISNTISDPRLIFEKGFTTTSGSGLGLSHIKNILENELNGTIEFNNKFKPGFGLIIRINR